VSSSIPEPQTNESTFIPRCPQQLLALLWLLSMPHVSFPAQVANDQFEEPNAAKADVEKTRPIISAYRLALETTPTAPGLNLQFGVRLWQLGEAVESKRAFERELQINPGSLAAQSMLAIIKVQERRYAEAARELQALIEKDAGLTQIWHPLGRAWFELGQFEEAKRCLEKAALMEPGVPQIQAVLAKTYGRLSDTSNAERASALYFEALKLKRSRDLAGAGKWGEALQLVSEYLAAFPLSSEGLYVKAAVLFNGFRNLDLAIETVHSSITQNPANLEARNFLAALFLAKGDSRGFEQEVRAILQVDPTDGRAYYYLGRFELDGRRLAQAREHLERARLLQPNDSIIATTLATAYEKLGWNQRAEIEYKNGVELSRRRPGDGAAYTYYAAFLLNENRRTEAMRYLDEAVASPSVRPEAWYLAGMAHLQNDELLQASQCLEKAIARRPDYAEAHSALGRVLQRKGDTAGALREFALGKEVGKHASPGTSDSFAKDFSIPR
jgi:tetratricopeptide (TPR) repeat protein